MHVLAYGSSVVIKLKRKNLFLRFNLFSVGLMDFFDGLVLLDGRRIPFPKKGISSNKVDVIDITIRNHPAYNRSGDAKQLVAKSFIAQHECIGFYGGQVKLYTENPNDDIEDWNPYQLCPKDTVSYYVDASSTGNLMRYINDSRGISAKTEPNVGFFLADKKVGGYFVASIVAIKDIHPGEEILVNYGDGYWSSLERWWKQQNPFTCDECEYRTTNAHNLCCHKSRNHDVKVTYDCDICGKQYKQADGLSGHMNKVHTHAKRYDCDECEFSTFSRTASVRHNATEHGTKHFKCFECDFMTADRTHWNRHLISKHGKDTGVKCGECNKSFFQKSDLRKHISSVHEKNKPWSCKQCDKSFSVKSSLTRHVDGVHLKRVKFSCDTCDFECLDKQTLLDHVNVKHNGMTHAESRAARKKLKK